MAKMTSAYANKLLKQLGEDKEFWSDKENNSCLYTAAVGETPVVPDYNYSEVTATIAEIDRKICVIKHAINLANVTSEIQVGKETMTVDTVLVAMAQKNKRKTFLDYLRKQQPKMRKELQAYNMRNTTPEYQYINYDLDQIKQEYEKVTAEIMDIQLALDKHNQTFEFEVQL